MLVSHLKKFIFLKTGKTAGTSVEEYFEPWCLPPGAYEAQHKRAASVTRQGMVGARGKEFHASAGGLISHITAADLRARVGRDVWDRYFKFAIVRNPFSKVVSWYHFRLSDAQSAELARSGGGAVIEHFRAWLQDGARLPRDKGYCEIEGVFALDFLMRFERLRGDLERVCGRLDIPFDPHALPRRKMGKRSGFPDWPDYYDEISAEIIRERYRWEFDTFGYARDPSLGDAATPGLPFQL